MLIKLELSNLKSNKYSVLFVGAYPNNQDKFPFLSILDKKPLSLPLPPEIGCIVKPPIRRSPVSSISFIALMSVNDSSLPSFGCISSTSHSLFAKLIFLMIGL